MDDVNATLLSFVTIFVHYCPKLYLGLHGQEVVEFAIPVADSQAIGGGFSSGDKQASQRSC